MWLDVLPMGSIIQPFAGMAFLLLFPLCTIFGWTQPGILLLPLVLCMVAAHLGALCELRYRISRNSLLETIPEGTVDTASRTPEELCLYCLTGRMIWHGLLYMGCYFVISFVVVFLLNEGMYPVLPVLRWPFVYALATIGAVLSLRDRRAYVVCAMGFAAILAVGLMGTMLS